MMDRRRSPRYVLLATADAHTRTLSEALIESGDGDRFVVTTAHAGFKGEELVMRFSTPVDELTACAVRVVSSEPVTGEGAPRFRLTLSVVSVFTDRHGDSIQIF
jgi:hypothetical protein